MQTEETEVYVNPKKFDIEELVKNATWKEILVELVERNQLNPWDIDIGKIVAGYIAIVKEMKVLDLYVPANIILAASVLLRMKSETITLLLDDKEELPEFPEMEQIRTIPEVPELLYTSRLRPGRRITLDDLMQALDEAMTVRQFREDTDRIKNTPVPLVLGDYDIDSKMDATQKLLKARADRYGKVTFSSLSKTFDSFEGVLLDLFVPLLFLFQKGIVLLEQETFFDEIIISLRQPQLVRAMKAVDRNAK
jgi:segregation and condensation protein A